MAAILVWLQAASRSAKAKRKNGARKRREDRKA
jgi:hypothetical protein